MRALAVGSRGVGMKNSCVHSSAAFLALSAASAPLALGADGPAMTYVTELPGCTFGSPGPGGASGGGYTMGWAFVPTQPVTVTALGFPDTGAPGFILDHTIHLWNQSRSVVRSVTAFAGPEPGGVMGLNGYRYYAITPIVLNAGEQYTIGVGLPAVGDTTAPSDAVYNLACTTTISFDPRITWLGGRLSGSLNQFPGQSFPLNSETSRSTTGTCNFLLVPPTPPCPGDLNSDGAVNTSDLIAFLGRFGQTVSPAGTGPDLVGDGVVNTSDLIAFLGKFGVPCP